MILLMSEYRDISTHKVIDWLKLYQVEYELIYKESYIDSIFFCSNELEYRFVCESKKINLTKVQFFWYRRGDINFTTNVRSIENTAIKNSISLNCNEEITVLSDFFHEFLCTKPHIGAKSEKQKSNKLRNLLFAKEAGLEIPNFKILSCKAELKFFQSEDIITKCMKDDLAVRTTEGYRFGTFGPTKIDQPRFEEISDNFFPSFFQKYIDKKFEIRVFIFGDFIWSMAIFSQQDERTELDYRNYNYRRPNRMTPYVLPEEIQIKLKLFMKIAQFSTGSVDLILNKEGQYIFLEINPVGQFGFVSSNCNYYIEKSIADFMATFSLH
jgi:ATP-GRASP peptide maturase of grasp-with-spasm system